jgi:hypothetical protein
MTRQETKKKRDKKRAEKRKHEHLTEHMAEEAAKKKHLHREEIVAIVVMLAFVPFMVIGVIWWPAGTSSDNAKGEIGLPDGMYTASYLGSRPATGDDVAVAALDVSGESVFANEHDLSGNARKDAGAFFDIRRGEPLEIKVKNGFITGWTPAETLPAK